MCDEHGLEWVHDCEECDSAREASTPVSVEPARWDWYVTVETWEPEECGQGIWLRETENWHFLSTELDPRDVEYE